MDTKAKLNEAMKEAMKSGDDLRKRTVRMVLAAVKQVEVDKRIELDDMAINALIQKEVKNRREALDDRGILRRFLANPTMTLGVVARIYWQALHLWRKRARFYAKPAPPSELVTR